MYSAAATHQGLKYLFFNASSSCNKGLCVSIADSSYFRLIIYCKITYIYSGWNTSDCVCVRWCCRSNQGNYRETELKSIETTHDILSSGKNNLGTSDQVKGPHFSIYKDPYFESVPIGSK